MTSVGRLLRRGVNASCASDSFEDWLGAAVAQLRSCRHLLHTRDGLLCGFRIGGHVYTVEGHYVGSFRARRERAEATELFSAAGFYLGERDPDDPERLGVDLSKLTLRLPAMPMLPALPTAPLTLYSAREPLLPRDGWGDYPAQADVRAQQRRITPSWSPSRL